MTFIFSAASIGENCRLIKGTKLIRLQGKLNDLHKSWGITFQSQMVVLQHALIVTFLAPCQLNLYNVLHSCGCIKTEERTIIL